MLDEATMEIDGISSADKDILKQLAKMVDKEGFTPLLRACQKYKDLQVRKIFSISIDFLDITFKTILFFY